MTTHDENDVELRGIVRNDVKRRGITRMTWNDNE